MAFAGECQTAINGDSNLIDLVQETCLKKVRHKNVASPHWADGMRRGRANADGEQIEGRDDSMFVVRFAVGASFFFISTRLLAPN